MLASLSCRHYPVSASPALKVPFTWLREITFPPWKHSALLLILFSRFLVTHTHTHTHIHKYREEGSDIAAS